MYKSEYDKAAEEFMKERHRELLGWGTVFLVFLIVVVGRFFYPGREVSWWECYTDLAHGLVGCLITLGCQGKKTGWYLLAIATILEAVMFALFKGWL